MVRLTSVVVGGDADPWRSLGFTVDDAGVIALANGAIELERGASGMVGVRLADTGDDVPGDVDGVPLLRGEGVSAVDHPNGCFELDHVVIATPSIERTSAAIEATLGLARRRIRETATVRQAFHRFADRGCIIELVESADAPCATLWGLVVNTGDLDGLVARCGPDLVGAPRAAVQPGRRIATVRRAAGVGIAVAVMSA